MKTIIKQKKILFTMVSFLIITLLTISYSCSPDAVLVDTNLKLPPVSLDTTGWKVINYSSQEDQDGEGEGNGRVWNTFDGKPDTFWHTCWNGCTAVPPHFFVVDMQESQKINGFVFLQRQSLSRNIEILSIEISDDNSTWTSLGEFTLEKSKSAQDKPLDKEVTARYFRLNVIKVFDGSNNAALAEITVYF
ncbi:discoidin domain-containing protein [Mariniflexile sp.]|uniref:discoidin domain-containing protein n=2 Tax=Mariniflexile sp. TaxID=1979402 RepID=UPI00404818A1